jgi:prevent-host-death family protein
MGVTSVSIRDLRNHGGAVVDRAARGETITITKAGERVAELRPLPRPRLSGASLLDRWRALPPVDPTTFRDDLGKLLDDTL